MHISGNKRRLKRSSTLIWFVFPKLLLSLHKTNWEESTLSYKKLEKKIVKKKLKLYNLPCSLGDEGQIFPLQVSTFQFAKNILELQKEWWRVGIKHEKTRYNPKNKIKIEVEMLLNYFLTLDISKECNYQAQRCRFTRMLQRKSSQLGLRLVVVPSLSNSTMGKWSNNVTMVLDLVTLTSMKILGVVGSKV